LRTQYVGKKKQTIQPNLITKKMCDPLFACGLVSQSASPRVQPD